jgi:hypothetical protein
MGDAEVMTHVTSGAVVVYAIEWAKSWGAFRWLTADTKALNRLVSAVAAAVIALGISVSGDGSSGWTIAIPPTSVLIVSGWEFVKQFVTQQVLFDTVIAGQKQ